MWPDIHQKNKGNVFKKSNNLDPGSEYYTLGEGGFTCTNLKGSMENLFVWTSINENFQASGAK